MIEDIVKKYHNTLDTSPMILNMFCYDYCSHDYSREVKSALALIEKRRSALEGALFLNKVDVKEIKKNVDKFYNTRLACLASAILTNSDSYENNITIKKIEEQSDIYPCNFIMHLYQIHNYRQSF